MTRRRRGKSEGVRVHAMKARVNTERAVQARELNRVPTGIPKLDEVLQGGFPKGSLILLSGTPGSGKTIFASQFLYEGAKRFGEIGVYASLSEGRDSMYDYLNGMGFDFARLEKEGTFKFLDLLTVTEAGVSAEVEEIFKSISTPRAKRLVIDSYSVLAQAFKEPISARQILHTILSKLVRSLGCTTIIIGEQRYGEKRIGDGMAEFVCDGVINLRRGPPRELEIAKMRGTRIDQTAHIFSINSGIHIVKTEFEGPKKDSKWVPIPDSADGLISSGSPDLDALLGGGFPKGAYVVVEAGTDVSLQTIRLLTFGITMNFLSQGRGVLYVPAGGADASEIRDHIVPYVGIEAFCRQMRVAEEMKESKDQNKPYIVLLKGGRNNIDFDTMLLYNTLDGLKKATKGKPVLRAIGYDTMESKYSEIPMKMYNEIGFAIMRTRAAGDISIGIARKSLDVLQKVLDMVDWHFRLLQKNGIVLFQGVKPHTQMFAVISDTGKGHPVLRLIPLN